MLRQFSGWARAFGPVQPERARDARPADTRRPHVRLPPHRHHRPHRQNVFQEEIELSGRNR